MTKLNNKGQTLVLFVVGLPILLFIIVLVVDVGSALNQKQELNNINNLAVSYGLDHLGEENLENKIINYINLNTNKMSNVEVRIDDGDIIVSTTKYVPGVISNLLNIDKYEVTSSYLGKIKENQKIIKRVK